MYSFEADEEQSMLVEAAGKLAEQVIRPVAHEADESGDLPEGVIARGWELGLLQASIPEAYGGFGERSALTAVLAAEELAWGDMAAALAIMLPATFALPILLSGTEEQKKIWLPRIAGDGWRPFSAAWIEPRYDFHAGDLRATADRDGDGYVINGQKAYVPYADRAEALMVYARDNGGVGAYVVDADLEGMTVGERQKLTGIGGLPVYPVYLEDVRVLKEDRVGGANALDYGSITCAAHVAMAAVGVGVARAAYEYSRDYAKEREAFGVPIAQKQSIAFMLAEMATEIEAIRLLVWEAAWLIDSGADASRQSHLALTGAADMAMMVTDRAVQILGGHGYIREHPVERWMRNGRGIATLNGLATV